MVRTGRLFAIMLASCAVSGSVAEGLVAHGAPGRAQACVRYEVRAKIESQITAYVAQFGRLGGVAGAEPYAFVPIGGVQYQDLLDVNFVDLDASAGILDFNCTAIAYDTHAGIDTSVRSFAEQAIGVPVFAVQDGIAMVVEDGRDDMNTCYAPAPDAGNYVVIDHGSGREGWYFHFRRNSIAVSVGQPVVAGQQIGLLGSSGYSCEPHLHFETRDDGVVHEPYAGPCRPGESGWVDQTPLNLTPYVYDFATSYEEPWKAPPWPYETPHSGQIALSDPFVAFWVQYVNLPAGSTWRVRFYRPDGLVEIDDGPSPFGNPFYRKNWGWWYYFVDFHGMTGTWHVRLDFNGQQMVYAPFEVRVERTPDFNRPPAPITVEFDPPAPQPQDVLFCRVNASMLLDDPDYDVVWFEYVWTVDGQEVRRVRSAGHADGIPRNTAGAGAVVECTVTPSDGRANAAPVTVSAVVGGSGCIACDLNCDGSVNGFDIQPFIDVMSNAAAPCSTCAGDANEDGSVNGFDIQPFVECLGG